MNPQWVVRKTDGVVYGPADTETVRKWLRERRISPDDQISLEGMENWRPVSATVEFQDSLGPAPGPAPTTSTRNRRVAIGVGAFALVCVAAVFAAIFVVKSLVFPTSGTTPHEVASTDPEGVPTKPVVTAARKPGRVSDPAKVPEGAAREEPKHLEPLTTESPQQQAAPQHESTPSQPAAPTGPNLIRNGDFSNEFAEWDKFHSSNVSDIWNLQIDGPDRYLSWSRKRSFNDGGSVGVVQTMDIDVSSFKKLLFSIDVMVKHHSLSNAGWWSERRGGSGEYPVKLIIFYKDAKGDQHMWTHGFISAVQRQPVVYKDPKSGRAELHDEKTTLANFTIVPRNEWHHYEVDLMDEGQLIEADLARRGHQMPRPHRLKMVRVVGQGWDFAAAVDNIGLQGE